MKTRRYVLTTLLLVTISTGLAACGGNTNAGEPTRQSVAEADRTAGPLVAATTTPGLEDSVAGIDENAQTPGTGTPRVLSRRAGTPQATGTPDGLLTPLAVASPTLTEIPTPAGPTETPTPTPLPTPDEQLANQIQQIQSKVEDLRAAVRDRDTTRMLQLQQELTKELPKLQDALKGADAPYAKELQQALSDLDGGMSGDMSKLDSAERHFNTAMGVQTENLKIQDPAQFAGQLADKVAAFEQALNSNDTGRLLGLQKDILNDVATAQQELQGSRSKIAGQVRDALGDVQNGVGGDYSKLNSAYSKLQEAAGRAEQGATPTPIVLATSTPTPTPVTRSQIDLAPYANDVQGKLNSLQQAVTSGTSDDIAKARGELQAAVAKAQDAINKDQSIQAQRFRDALGTAAGAAAGDNAKIADALTQLSNAMKQ